MAITTRLTIEPLAVAHAPGLFAALDDERVGRYTGGAEVTTLDALVERIEFVNDGPGPGYDEQWRNWAVRSGGVIIGRVEATLYVDWAEIAYVFGPAWWGHGYATEATRWMIDHLTRVERIREFWACVIPENTTSIALLERLGFDLAEPRVGLGSYDPGDLVYVLRAES